MQGIRLTVGRQPLADVAPEVLQRVVAVPYSLGEFIVQFGKRLGLDGMHRYGHSAFLAGVLGLSGVIRYWQGEILFLPFSHALQVYRKSWQRHGIVLLQDEVDAVVVNYGFAKDGAFYTDVQQVSELGGPVHWVPGRRLEAELLHDLIHLFVGYLNRLPIQPDGAEITQFDYGLEGNNSFELDRFHFHQFQLRFRERLKVLVF